MTVTVLHGDCRDVLATLPSESVHCCITSPPYWGLRSYLPNSHKNKHREIGSERTIYEWVDTMVEVFDQVRRVLRKDGTLWLNLGDSYAGSRCGGPTGASKLRGGLESQEQSKIAKRAMTQSARRDRVQIPRSDIRIANIKPKDLVGQPWMVAFALREAGWWLRQEIIWHKLNPMPESNKDRFTKAHEQVFLFSKSKRYYFDHEAIKEPASERTHARISQSGGTDWVSNWARGDMDHSAAGLHAQRNHNGHQKGAPPKAAHAVGGNDGAYADGKSGRMGRAPGWRAKVAEPDSGIAGNKSMEAAISGEVLHMRAKRDVWSLTTEPFPGAHFATFPTELVVTPVVAGCPVGGKVLDPFAGSGTVGLVCDRLQRDAILIDLDERNIPMATNRVRDDAPLFADVNTPT